jgi:hypothetical protein
MYELKLVPFKAKTFSASSLTLATGQDPSLQPSIYVYCKENANARHTRPARH